MRSEIIAGVDGGGSGTRVIIADEAGVELATASGPASALRPDTAARSADVIIAVVRDALSRLPEADARLRVLCAGVAGAGRQTIREALALALQESGIADDVIVETDATVAMQDALGDSPGILLIAGTGSVAFGRSPTGVLARAGGWGMVCGDEGSGYWIGRRALSTITAACDGREPETALTGAILTAAEVSKVDDIIAWAARADAGAIAELASVVLQQAEAGDLRADSLVALATEELAIHVRTLARRLFGDERAAVSVALGGGLLRRGSPLRARLEQRLRTCVPGAELHPEEVSPARGAMRIAMRALSGVAAR